MLFDYTIITIISLFSVAVFAGIVDTISGGGGLLTLPALLTTGLPPTTALGTNRIQGCIGELTAIWRFKRYRSFTFKPLIPGLICTCIGAIAGTELVEHIDPQFLTQIIPWLMLAVLIYSLFIKPHNPSKISLSYTYYTCCFGLIIGMYNGFFGPGTGSLWLFGFVAIVGLSLKQASIHTKPFNCIGNIISGACFFSLGHVAITLTLVMGLGQIIGASIGAHLVIHKGDKLIKPFFITVVFIMTAKLFIDNYGFPISIISAYRHCL